MYISVGDTVKIENMLYGIPVFPLQPKFVTGVVIQAKDAKRNNPLIVETHRGSHSFNPTVVEIVKKAEAGV